MATPGSWRRASSATPSFAKFLQEKHLLLLDYQVSSLQSLEMPSVAERRNRHENIFLAASDDDLLSVTQFLDAGVDVNSLDANGYTCLHAASSYNHISLMRHLVSRGGNVNLPDFEGDTPLFVAETREMCALLVHELGADVAWKNHDGLHALDYMIEQDEFPDAIAYLTSVVPSAPSAAASLSASASAAQSSSSSSAAAAAAESERRQDYSGVSVEYREQDPVAHMNGAASTNGNGQEAHEATSDADMMQGLPQEAREKIWRVLGDSARDGVNRDDELREILSQALVGQGFFDNHAEGNHTRQRRE